MSGRGWVGLLLAAVLALGARADEPADTDDQMLRDAHVATDGDSLLAFFRARSLTAEDRDELTRQIKELGNDNFAARQRASHQIIRFGQPAVPYLRQALANTDPEVVRRARFCIEELERAAGPALPAAAARMLALRRPAGAIPVLLNYLPFNEDESVEEQVLTALATLTAAGGGPDPAVINAVHEREPARRAGAAFVLARDGAPEHQEVARQFLSDSEPKVRLRAAQGLLAAQDRNAVPALIALVVEGPVSVGWQAEETLYRIAQDQSPVQSIGTGEPESRKRAGEAWLGWWRDAGARVDLARIEDRQHVFGLTVIAELDSNRVWECGRDGKPRWKLENLQGPIDARVLPGGRVLIAENQGQRVTERDLQGRVLWEHRLDANPICCERLPNGNTFIASYQGVMEVTRDGKEVYHRRRGAGFFIFGAQRMRNGHVVCMSAQGAVIEMDAKGKEVRTVHVQTNGNWCNVEALPGGHYLVALAGNNKVAEVDSTGKAVWQCTTIPSPCFATRLPNGNTLVASMMHRRVVEVDRAGKTVWETATDGRPFHAHRR
jgi:HEAT repeat protein